MSSQPNVITLARNWLHHLNVEFAVLDPKFRGTRSYCQIMADSLDTLDHEATTDEWRCPGFCEGMYECRCNTPFRVPGPCLCCQRETQHVLVVPVRDPA